MIASRRTRVALLGEGGETLGSLSLARLIEARP
jgi:hypothetical protein